MMVVILFIYYYYFITFFCTYSVMSCILQAMYYTSISFQTCYINTTLFKFDRL